MNSPLLQIAILAVLLGPAYTRWPWLLVLVGGAGGLYFLAPELSGAIHSVSTLALVVTVVGYLVTMLSSAMESS